MATSGDILLATREDFYMATDTLPRPAPLGLGGPIWHSVICCRHLQNSAIRRSSRLIGT